MGGFTAAERQQVWLHRCGTVFEKKCFIRWCKNKMNVFQFHVGHNKPKANGGANTLDNLVPICGNCNMSMGKRYTIDEWNAMYETKSSWCCIGVPRFYEKRSDNGKRSCDTDFAAKI